MPEASRPYAQPHAETDAPSWTATLERVAGTAIRVALLIVGMAVETTAGCATGIDESVMPAERFAFEPMVVLTFGTRGCGGRGRRSGSQTVKDGRCTEHAPSAYRELCLPRLPYVLSSKNVTPSAIFPPPHIVVHPIAGFVRAAHNRSSPRFDTTSGTWGWAPQAHARAAFCRGSSDILSTYEDVHK